MILAGEKRKKMTSRAPVSEGRRLMWALEL